MAGVRLVDLNPKIGTDEDPEKWVDVHKQVINGYVWHFLAFNASFTMKSSLGVLLMERLLLLRL